MVIQKHDSLNNIALEKDIKNPNFANGAFTAKTTATAIILIADLPATLQKERSCKLVLY